MSLLYQVWNEIQVNEIVNNITVGNSDTIFKYFSLEIRKRLSIRLKNDNQKSLEMAWHRYLTLLFVMLIKSHWTQGLSKVQLSNKTFYKSCWYHDNFAHCSTRRGFLNLQKIFVGNMILIWTIIFPRLISKNIFWHFCNMLHSGPKCTEVDLYVCSCRCHAIVDLIAKIEVWQCFSTYYCWSLWRVCNWLERIDTGCAIWKITKV